jgi:hypothetical protein
MMYAIEIPLTSPQCYISFKHALNLRFPQEDTGEWHFLTAFFDDHEKSRSAPLAGAGEGVDTTPSLGDLGIREMSQILKAQQIMFTDTPVYVANHYRAIADLAMLQLLKGQMPTIATARAINQWLDTEEQINHLVNDYLMPLRSQLDKATKNIFDKWIVTVRYE